MGKKIMHRIYGKLHGSKAFDKYRKDYEIIIFKTPDEERNVFVWVER
jgi:hypothetical protein